MLRTFKFRSNVIVGSGMIANAFRCITQDQLENTTIFASGVSNSKSTCVLDYQLEFDYIRKYVSSLPIEHKFAYFSTCSIDDPERSLSPYVEHKIKIERFLKNSCNAFIFRLPQVVGYSNNPHTLTNFFYNSLVKNTNIVVQSFATRNLIDVEDVAKIVVHYLVSNNSCIDIVNIGSTFSTKVEEIVKQMAFILNVVPIIQYVNSGFDYKIDVPYVLAHSNSLGIHFDKNYNNRLLNKYYSTGAF